MLTDVRTEQVRGAGIEHILSLASIQHEAEDMMEEVRSAIANAEGATKSPATPPEAAADGVLRARGLSRETRRVPIPK